MPLRAHLLSLQRQNIKTILDDPDCPHCPDNGALVWAKFLQLHRQREQGEFEPRRLTWTAIQAWQSVTHSTLEPWELTAIFRLEDAYFISLNSVESDLE